MIVKVIQEYNHLPAIAAELRPKAQAAINKAAVRIEARIKTMMQDQKSGRTYPRGSRMHTASAPGEAPAIDYGALINSIQLSFGDMQAAVYSNMEYAPHLEFGTTKMAPRPAWIPAAEGEWESYLAELRRIV